MRVPDGVPVARGVRVQRADGPSRPAVMRTAGPAVLFSTSQRRGSLARQLPPLRRAPTMAAQADSAFGAYLPEATVHSSECVLFAGWAVPPKTHRWRSATHGSRLGRP